MLKKANRAVVLLTEPLTRRRILEEAKPEVKVARLIEKAYWEAWDRRSDCVYLTLEASQTVDGERKHYILPVAWFKIQEARDDA